MKPGRRKYVIAAALFLLPLVGLGLGWGFYRDTTAMTGSRQPRSDSLSRRCFIPMFPPSSA